MEKPEYCQLPVIQLTRGSYQPRRHFDPEQLEELAQSIRSHGIVQPIVVRPISHEKYEIVAGERRWRAAQLAGIETIPCLVKSYSDEQTAEIATLENVNRVDLNPIEEAQAYQRLIQEFGYIHEEIAAAVGKVRSKITNSLRLLKLEPQIQQWLMDNQLSEGHGKVLAGLPPRQQLHYAQCCLDKQWSVRRLENEIKHYQQPLKDDNTKKDPNIAALERQLTDKTGCPTLIHHASGKGELTFQFHDLEVLQGILQKLGVFEYE
jgi:ParB family chromosome partitioning protein